MEYNMKPIVDLMDKSISNLEKLHDKRTFGTMDFNCEHDIEKLYDKIGNYKADHCKKCGGVY